MSVMNIETAVKNHQRLKTEGTREIFNHKSVQIFSVEGNKIVPHWNTINSIFICDEKINKNYLKVIVACGLPRKGKSTICNFLYNKRETADIGHEVTERTDLFGNMKDNDDKHQNVFKKNTEVVTVEKVFETANGMKMKTSGIWITPKPTQFKSNGKIINTFIVDCQGVFGSSDDNFINQKIFVLGTLMASQLIYNIMLPFEPSHGDLLEEFVVSTMTLLKSDGRKPFQKLVFLFRDLLNEKEYKYGSKDAEKYIKFLKEYSKIDLKKFDLYFENIDYYFMPKPDNKVRDQEISDSDSVLTLNDFGDLFIKHCERFRTLIMDKTIKQFVLDGNCLTGETYTSYLNLCFETIENGKLKELPQYIKVLSFYENNAVLEQIEAQHRYEMKMKCKEITRHFEISNFDKRILDLTSFHSLCVERALEKFNKNQWSQIKGPENIDFRVLLKNNLTNEFNHFIENFKVYKDCWYHYTNKMRQFLEPMDDKIIAKMKNGAAKPIHDNLYEEYLNEFKTICHNNGMTYEIDFIEELKSKMNKFYKFIDRNSSILIDKLKIYENEIKEGYNNRGWLEISSNKLLELDNTHYEQLQDEFSGCIKDQGEIYIDFLEIFKVETEKLIKLKYENTKSTEDKLSIGAMVSGLVVFVGSAATGGVALGVAGMIIYSGSLIFGIYRRMSKPNKKRENNKKRQ